jgi:HlyD family secretion protein
VRNGRFTLPVMVGMTVVLAALSGWLGVRVRSPAQISAAMAEPPAVPITAAVERRPLRATLVLEGSVKAPPAVEVFAPPSVADAQVIVTRAAPPPGGKVTEGQRLVEVSGRPVFLLRGGVPMYRNLRPGSRGKDVAQLQAALARLGFASGDAEGVFGAGTEAAVRDFYHARGYEPLLEPVLARQARQASGSADPTGGDALGVIASGLPGSSLPGSSQTGAGPAHGRPMRENGSGWDGTPAPPAIPRADTVKGTRGTAGHPPPRPGPAPAPGAVPAPQHLPETPPAPGADRAQPPPAAEQLVVPWSEVVFVSRAPTTIVTSRGGVGQRPHGPLLTLADGDASVEVALDTREREMVRPGTPVRVEPSDGGEAVQAKVKAVDGETARVVLRKPLPGAGAGAQVRVTVETSKTSGAVLTVPLAAIWSRADGTTRLTVLDGGATREVVVEPGLSADGMVEVTPVAGSLAPGDEVVIGATGGGPDVP